MTDNPEGSKVKLTIFQFRSYIKPMIGKTKSRQRTKMPPPSRKTYAKPNEITLKPAPVYQIFRPAPCSTSQKSDCLLAYSLTPNVSEVKMLEDQLSLCKTFALPKGYEDITLHIKGKKKFIGSGYRFSFTAFQHGNVVFKEVENCQKPWEFRGILEKLEKYFIGKADTNKITEAEFKTIAANTKFPFRLKCDNGQFTMSDKDGVVVHIDRKQPFSIKNSDLFLVSSEGEMYIYWLLACFYDMTELDIESKKSTRQPTRSPADCCKYIDQLLNFYLSEASEEARILNTATPECKYSIVRFSRLLHDMSRLIHGMYSIIDINKIIENNKLLHDIDALPKMTSGKERQQFLEIATRFCVGEGIALAKLCRTICKARPAEDWMELWKAELYRLDAIGTWKKWKTLQGDTYKQNGELWRLKKNFIYTIFEVCYNDLLGLNPKARYNITLTTAGITKFRLPDSQVEIQRGDNIASFNLAEVRLYNLVKKKPHQDSVMFGSQGRRYFLPSHEEYLVVSNDDSSAKLFKFEDLPKGDLSSMFVNEFIPSKYYFAASTTSSRLFALFKPKKLTENKDWYLGSIKVEPQNSTLERRTKVQEVFNRELTAAKTDAFKLLDFHDTSQPVAASGNVMMMSLGFSPKEDSKLATHYLIVFAQDGDSAGNNSFSSLDYSEVVAFGENMPAHWMVTDHSPKVASTGFVGKDGALYFLHVMAPPLTFRMFKVNPATKKVQKVPLALSETFMQRMCLTEQVMPVIVSVAWKAGLQQALVFLGYPNRSIGISGELLPAGCVAYVNFD